MIEEWKDVPEYEGLYQVSNFGGVRSLKFGKTKLLKQRKNIVGYLIVDLYKESSKKTRTVHQLVAIAFLNHKPCGYKLVVNHKDLNKENNYVDNLEVVTQRLNSDKSHLITTSKYTGVCWSKVANKWVSHIRLNGKKKHLGCFKNEIDAHLAYQKELNKL